MSKRRRATPFNYARHDGHVAFSGMSMATVAVLGGALWLGLQLSEQKFAWPFAKRALQARIHAT